MNSLKVHNLTRERRLLAAVVAGICLLLAIAVLPGSSARAECAIAADGAGVIADSTCDCNYMQSLESQAWMTAQREITQNQNLIAKADSVLEYTCFDSFLRVTVSPAVAGLFSETPAWGFPPGRSDMSTDIAVQGGVYVALASYLAANFPHTFLGARVPLDYIPTPVMGGGAYTCSMLAQVWQLAKCYNFATMAQDGWFSFENYASTPDKRMLPDPCADDGRWQPQLDLSYLLAPWYVAQTPINEETFMLVSEFLMPGNCQAAHPTGVIVESYLRPTHPDAFCTNPGCDFDGGGCSP